MTVEYIGLIAVAVGIAGLFFGPSFIVFVFFGATLLGSAAATVLEALGANISPAHLLLAFLAVKLLRQEEIRKNLGYAIMPGRPGFWLLLTIVYCIISAYFMPRIFQGQTLIFPVRSIGYAVPLEPATSNVTQTVYLIGDFICFVLLYAFASAPGGRTVLGNAALACAVLNLVFVSLDLFTYWTGTAELLSFIRNANYAMLSETEVAGVKRIVGSFTEASSFSSSALGYFAFTLRLWLLNVRPRLTLSLAMLLLGALLFSTSTTAYLGFALFGTVVYVEMIIEAISMPLNLNRHKFLFLVAAPIVALIVVLFIALSDSYSSYVGNMLDSMVFNKMSTDSGIERSAWNAQGFSNFLDTFGFGVGNGSMRSSSFPISVLASLGIIGTPIFTAFFVSVLFSSSGTVRVDPLEEVYRQAGKSVCIAAMITAIVSAALTDLGLPFFVFAALTSATPTPWRSARNPKAVELRFDVR